MTEEDLVCVESHLGPLPAEFRRFLLAASTEDLRDLGCGVYGVGKLIKENAHVRLDDEIWRVIRPEGGEVPWPVDWLVVSDNGAGDYWFVRTEDSGQSLWFWSHESSTVSEDARSIADSIQEGRARRLENERLNPRPPMNFETIDHPGLGSVEFRGSFFFRKGEPMLYDWTDGLTRDSHPEVVRAVLDAVAPLASEALAAQNRVIEEAMPQLVELQHEPMWWLPNAPKLAADQIRNLIRVRSVEIRTDSTGNELESEVEYAIDGGEAFGWDPILVHCGADFSVNDVERREYI